MRIPFLEFLKDNIVLFDGAMGTEIYNKGIFINTYYDELKPELNLPSLNRYSTVKYFSILLNE